MKVRVCQHENWDWHVGVRICFKCGLKQELVRCPSCEGTGRNVLLDMVKKPDKKVVVSKKKGQAKTVPVIHNHCPTCLGYCQVVKK